MVGINEDYDEDFEDVQSIVERFCQKGLLIFRACVKMVFNPANTFKYRHAQEKEEKSQAIELVKGQILTEGFVRQIFELLITKFFVFRSSDIRQWNEDPEEWDKRDEGEGDDYEFSTRAAAEKLFLDLSNHFQPIVIEPLINVFRSVSGKFKAWSVKTSR